MLRKKITIILIITFAIVLLFSCKSFAGSQKLNSLDFDVKLNTDGSMDVIETWNVYAYDTNTLFKTFNYDPRLFDNVSVYDVTDDRQYEDVGILQYHVDTWGFYGLKNDDGDFEIAWNIGADNTSKTKTYKIAYTVRDVITVYNDCAEFYWQFISDFSGIPANDVTGTIKLPNRISNMENLRVWAHGPLIGEITKYSDDTAKFDLPKLDTNTMLEVRVVTPPGIFETAINRKDINKLNSIIAEETVWAEEANNQRIQAQKQIEKQNRIITLCAIVISGLSLISLIKKKNLLEENPKIIPTEDWEYFRDIPEESATPADAEFMIKLGKNFNTGNVISAILLDLSLKKYLSFEVDPLENNKVKMVINKNSSIELSQDEQVVFDFIKKAAGGNDFITSKEFKKYAARHNEAAYSLWQSVSKIAKRRNTLDDKHDSDIEKKGSNFAGTSILWVFVAAAGLMFSAVNKITFAVTIIAVLNIIECVMLAKRLTGFNQNAIDIKQKWIGLKKFMEEFSLLDERDIPELELWEKFLVYATAFGIAEKVLKQLKMKFPELQDDNYFRNRYAAMYYCTNYNMGRDFEKSIHSAYTARASEIAASSMSSGSGGGGGFSGGGGRWRRPEAAWEEDKI